jgi:hypothetical protein
VKRTALILLTFVYLLSCTGVAVDRFYCCGKLATVNLIYGASDHSDSKTDKKKDNCCKNERQNFKIKDNHFSAASFSLHHPLPVVISNRISFDLGEVASLVPLINVYHGHAPPGFAVVPIYTLYCTYRI